MRDGFDDTVTSLRRLVTTGAVVAAVVLVGAVVLLALSLLFQVSQFSPFGLWGVLAVVAVAAIVGAVAWVRGPGAFGRLRPDRPVRASVVLHAPPPPPARLSRDQSLTSGGGRLGAEALVNLLISQNRYAEALDRLTALEAADPAMVAFCAAKRRAIGRRRTRAHASRA